MKKETVSVLMVGVVEVDGVAKTITVGIKPSIGAEVKPVNIITGDKAQIIFTLLKGDSNESVIDLIKRLEANAK